MPGTAQATVVAARMPPEAPAPDVPAPSAVDHELPRYADIGKDTPATTTTTTTTTAAADTDTDETAHVFSLRNPKGRAWLLLRVRSRAPRGAALPLFTDGDTVCGEVQVDLERAERAKAVVVSIRAEVTAVGQEPVPFVDLAQTLWPPSASSASSGAKLAGTQRWPFALRLPATAALRDAPGAAPRTFALPPSVSERASAAYVDYRLGATVRRGALRVDQTLSTSVAYVPRSRAPAPSALRRLAYAEGLQLVGPEGDPDGWAVLREVQVEGTLFDARKVAVRYTLALAKPLTYAAGSPLPLLLTMASTDATALDLLSAAAAAPRVVLTRTLAIGSAATDAAAPRRSNNTFAAQVGRACFWPAGAGAGEEGLRVRRMWGEVEVRRGLKPSFVFPRFTVRYHISMYAPTAPGFVPTSAGDQPLLLEPVTIVTSNAPGVVPRSHAPPGYVKPQEGDYNNSVGYLENGNQRFYHHHGW